MRLLITRAAPGAARTHAALAAAGREAIVSSVLQIAFTQPGAAAPAQAALLTSAAAARAPGARAYRRLPAFVTGAGTARAARQAGFEIVESADGAGAELAALIRARLDPAGGPLVHLAGARLAFDIAAALTADGFQTRTEIMYRAAPAPALTGEALAALRRDPPALQGVIFHSVQGVESFEALLRAAALEARAPALDVFCLSARVGAAARTALAWRAVHVASAPTEKALLALVLNRTGERS